MCECDRAALPAAWQPCTAPNSNLFTVTNLTAAADYHQRDGARLHWFPAISKWILLGGWWAVPADWDASNLVTNEVWTSPDLVTWTKILTHDNSPPKTGATARWMPVHTFMSWVHDDKIFIMGSDQYQTPTLPIPSEVWSSVDGETWVRVAEDCPWGTGNGLYNPIPGYLNGYMYVLGGHRQAAAESYLDWMATNEVWRTTDGVTWEQLDDMPFSVGGVMDAVTLCNKMFVIGGNAGSQNTRSLSSATWGFDGVSWRQMSADSNGVWSARDYVSAAAYDDRLFLLTGYDGVNAGGLRWSRDLGVTWERCPAPAYSGSHADAIAVGNGIIAIASGNNQAQNTYSIVAV